MELKSAARKKQRKHGKEKKEGQGQLGQRDLVFDSMRGNVCQCFAIWKTVILTALDHRLGPSSPKVDSLYFSSHFDNFWSVGTRGNRWVAKDIFGTEPQFEIRKR